MMFNVLEFNYNRMQATGRISGHPTAALDKAYALSREVFPKTMAWRFVEIGYVPPSENDLASAGIINFVVRVV